MSGGFMPETGEYAFTGLQKHFNSFTKRGRLNWVLATYGTIFGYVAIKKMFGGKKQPAVTAK